MTDLSGIDQALLFHLIHISQSFTLLSFMWICILFHTVIHIMASKPTAICRSEAKRYFHCPNNVYRTVEWWLDAPDSHGHAEARYRFTSARNSISAQVILIHLRRQVSLMNTLTVDTIWHDTWGTISIDCCERLMSDTRFKNQVVCFIGVLLCFEFRVSSLKKYICCFMRVTHVINNIYKLDQILL